MMRSARFLLFLAAAMPAWAVRHADLIATWDDAALERGETLYREHCGTCHGTATTPGSLPTARLLHRDVLRNGSDPFSMFRTITKGYGQMPPWPQFSAREVYEVIHYVRETQIRPHRPDQYVPVTPDYLAGLPTEDLPDPPRRRDAPTWRRMDYGRAQFYTIEIAPGNIAYKGLAVRLDPGAGGVMAGRAWMLYDLDTLRMGAAWTGSGYIDGRSIAFDQSHQSHPSLVGTVQLANPPGPGVARPDTLDFTEPRALGADGKPYGPMPRTWARYTGLHLSGDRCAIAYQIGDTAILETPGLIETGGVSVFTRTLRVDAAPSSITLRIAPDAAHVMLDGTGARLVTTNGFHIAVLPAHPKPRLLRIRMSRDALPSGEPPPLDDPLVLTKGGPLRWPGSITLAGKTLDHGGPLAVDTIPAPNLDANPWRSWMRLGGFDFMPDGRSAAVCTWLGDVWLVEGLGASLERVTWRRIASGLFQPLGLKVVNGVIHVTCRDQIARLHDLDENGEADWIECFNSDHQVTEHFHEFAMGLQTDRDGNFYYAKSGCHGKKAVVPQHGTLLRVDPTGTRTDILATGFRAANGVCVNDDGTFLVTDQEGFWMPENRINLVRPSNPPRFYGNQWGYAPPESDDAIEPPLCWISNEFDRSPAELVRVKSRAWGAMDGQLLNLSYGMGRLYTVLTEDRDGLAQGGMYAVPLPDFPTGLMRGRFHPEDGHLYACGLYAWAGNRHEDGGFVRIRATGRPWNQPVALHAAPGRITLTLSDPVDPVSVSASNITLRVWGLERTERYGSPHLDERSLELTRVELREGRTVELTVPGLSGTPCYALGWNLQTPQGGACTGLLHGTVHPASVRPRR